MLGMIGAVAFVLTLVLGYLAAVLAGLVDPTETDVGGGI